MMLDCGGRLLDLTLPRVMGILNITPDSFSDGGVFLSTDAALRRAERMIEDGADIIDVGGESTRPGAEAVSADEERRRVVPVIEAIVQRFHSIVSVDTSKPQIMRAAADVGAGMINDVRALQAEGALDAARRHRSAGLLDAYAGAASEHAAIPNTTTSSRMSGCFWSSDYRLVSLPVSVVINC
jgi:dihydropteroate synthase